MTRKSSSQDTATEAARKAAVRIADVLTEIIGPADTFEQRDAGRTAASDALTAWMAASDEAFRNQP